MKQQVEVKRYNQSGDFLFAYADSVDGKETPVYANAKEQLTAEKWNMQMIDDDLLDHRSLPSIQRRFKKLDKRYSGVVL